MLKPSMTIALALVLVAAAEVAAQTRAQVGGVRFAAPSASRVGPTGGFRSSGLSQTPSATSARTLSSFGGGAPFWGTPRQRCRHGWDCRSCGWSRPWYTRWDGRTWTWPPLVEVERRVEPQVVIVAPPEPPPPPPDEGLAALATRDFGRATIVYAQRLADAKLDESSTPQSRAGDQRLMALAMIGMRRFTEGATAMRAAYTADPTLSDRPLNGAALLGGSMEVRRLVNGAVEYAHRAGSSDAWFAVAVLMQAEGRNDRARLMFDRSDALVSPGAEPLTPPRVQPPDSPGADRPAFEQEHGHADTNSGRDHGTDGGTDGGAHRGTDSGAPGQPTGGAIGGV